MSVYYINSYDIENIEEFKKYAPAVYPLLQKYGAKVLAADTELIVMEGTARTMNAIIRFPSKEAALNCYNDPEYQEIKKIRINSTKNCTMVLAKQITVTIQAHTMARLHLKKNLDRMSKFFYIIMIPGKSAIN